MNASHLRPSAPDPLDHPDPARAADAVASEALLRAYVRETGTHVPQAGAVLEISLAASGMTLRVPVRHRSASGWHRFGEVRVVTAGGASGERRPTETAADVALVAAAAIRETTGGRGVRPHLGSDAVARVLNSARRTEAHLTARRAETARSAATDAAAQSRLPFAISDFLDGEQALLLGHPFHPAPKSREEASDDELARYSPELRGSFAPHWFAADPAIVVGESSDAAPVAEHLRSLARAAGLDAAALADAGLPARTLVLPAHPWQAREVARRPDVRQLIEDGSLTPLGPHGPRWYPTSSVRTVYRPDADVMMKLSLGMRITNSRRNNLRGEMRLGVSGARLLAAGPTAWLSAEHPRFTILRDFAWCSVGLGDAETGLETALRDNPFISPSGPDSPGAQDSLGGLGGRTPQGVCVAGLLAERTGPGDGRPPRYRALLVQAVERATAAHAVSPAEAARLWLRRYLQVLAVPLIRLQARYGIALEPHHQNTLVALGSDGLPMAGWYRDSQGYYLYASRAEEWESLVPGVTKDVEIVFDDDFVDERVAYYLGINNLLGLVGALGALGLAAEEDLLAELRATLCRLRATEAGARRLLDLLLDARTLRCKGNYLTCVEGLDELVGEVHTQSVYIDLPNPLAEALR